MDSSYKALWSYASGYQYGTITGLPAGCTLSSPSTSTGWSWDGYYWYLNPGSTGTLTCTTTAGTSNITVRPTLSGVAMTNGATAPSLTASETLTISNPDPDLVVTKVADKTTAAVGDTVTWTVTVNNAGGGTSSTYALADTVPSQFTSVAASGCTVAGQAVTCNGAALAGGASKTFVITAKAGTTLGSFTNSATATMTGEKVTTNNTGASTVAIANAVPGSAGTVTSSDGYVSLTKTASTYNLAAPGSVTYTYSIKNLSSTYREYWSYGTPSAKLVDDKCTSVTGPSSAAGWAWDGYDFYIAPGATATLSCTKVDTVTTTNTATLSGLLRYNGPSTYNGITAAVSAKATVVVAASVPLKDPTTLGLTPFACSTSRVFDAYGAPTVLGSQTQGSSIFDNVGSTWSSTYNGIAYNADNDLIYAVTQRTSSGQVADENRIVAIDSTGAVTDLGTLKLDPAYANTAISYGTVSGITGGRVTSVSTYGQAWSNDIYGGINFGFFDDSGTYWIGNASSSGSGVMYKVDLTTGYVTPLAKQSAAIRENDLSYAFGYAWGIKNNTNTIVRVNLGTGAVTEFPVTTYPGLKNLPAGTYGAAWTYGNGNLGFDINTGGVYQVQVINPDSSAPSFQLVASSTGPASTNNDGTSCSGQPTDLKIEKTGSTTVATGGTATWSLKVTSLGPGVSSGFTVTDPVPANFTYSSVSWTGGTCTYDTASKTLICVSSGTIAAGTSTTISVTAKAGTVNACYTNSASVKGNESDTYAANDVSSVQTCVGTGQAPTCDSVMFGSFWNASSGAGYVGTVVTGKNILSTPTGVWQLPTQAADRYDVTKISSAYPQTSAMAIDTLDPNYVYYGSRSMTTYGTSLYRYDLRTQTSTVVSGGSNAWNTNRMAVAPDGAVWSFANNGHLYSYNPAQGGVDPQDWGIIKSITTADGTTLDFTKLQSGDIAFDGAGNMWILASTGQDSWGNYGPTYLLTVAGAQLGSTMNPTPTVVGKMSNPDEGYYNGIAFGSDGTLYASTLGTSNYIYVVDPATGITEKKQSYTTGGRGQFGDLGSCALPKPSLAATKSVTSTSNPVVAGSELTYTIKVTNSGNLAATGVQVRDVFPSGVTYRAGSTVVNGAALPDVNGRFPYATWYEGHGTQTKFPGVIPPKDGATISFTVIVDDSFTGTQICNQGNLQYTSRELSGIILTDDASVTGAADPTCTAVGQPSFAVAKTATSPASGTDASVGTTVTLNPDGTATVSYTVVATNTGAAAGKHPAITDTLSVPAGFGVIGVSYKLPDGTIKTPALNDATFTIEAGTTSLAPKASASYVVTVQLKASDLTAVNWTAAGTCSTTGAGDPAKGAFNQVTLDNDTDGPDNNDACVPIKSPVTSVVVSKIGLNCDAGVATCPLQGSTFALYDVDPTTTGATAVTSGAASTGTSLNQWKASDLRVPGTYWLVETKAPSGHELLADPVQFKIDGTGITVLSGGASSITTSGTVAGNNLQITVADTTPTHLPKVGREGPWLNYALGLALVFAAAAFYLMTSGRRSAAANPRQ